MVWSGGIAPPRQSSALPPGSNCGRQPQSCFGGNQLSPRSVGISPLPTARPSLFQQTPVRPSTRFCPRLSLAMGSSRGFGSAPGNLKRPFRTRFPSGSAEDPLNRAPKGGSLARSTKSTPSAKFWPPSVRGPVVSVSLSLPSRGSFHLSLTVLSAVGRWTCLALGGGPPVFPRGFTCPAVLAWGSGLDACPSPTRPSRSPAAASAAFGWAWRSRSPG